MTTQTNYSGRGLSEEQKFAVLRTVLSRALERQPARVLIAMVRGSNVPTPGLVISWRSAVENSKSYRDWYRDKLTDCPEDYVLQKFSAWVERRVLDSMDLSDRWHAYSECCHVLAHCEQRLDEDHVSRLQSLAKSLYEETRDVVLDDVRRAALLKDELQMG